MILFLLKQKTAYEVRISDWSSDVCSSDLIGSSHDGDASFLVCGIESQPHVAPDQEAACVRGCMACIHLTEQHAGPNGEQLRKQIVGGECVPDSAPEGGVDMTFLFQHFGQDAEIGRASCRERVCQYV